MLIEVTSLMFDVFQDDLDDMEIIFRHQGVIIYIHKTSAQSCLVTLEPFVNVSLAVYMPNIKVKYIIN